MTHPDKSDTSDDNTSSDLLPFLSSNLFLVFFIPNYYLNTITIPIHQSFHHHHHHQYHHQSSSIITIDKAFYSKANADINASTSTDVNQPHQAHGQIPKT
jgi:hypothetical protein